MAIQPVQGGGGQAVPPQGPVFKAPPARVSVPPNLQGLPLDTLGLKTQPPQVPRLSPDRRLSDLKPDELSSLGGGNALESLARTQSNLTLGEAMPLIHNKPALESISGLLERRSDLRVSDFVSRDARGKVSIDPSYKNSSTMEFLQDRQDLMPSEVSAMKANMVKGLKNPRLAGMASDKALNLLKERRDLSPEEAGELLTDLSKAAGVGQGASAAQAGPAAVSMFDNATQLLTRRTDLHPDRVGDLAKSVGDLGPKGDKERGPMVAEGFKAATQTLENNALRQPEELSRMASTVGDHFKGPDAKSASKRMNAFVENAKKYEENVHLDSRDVDKQLQSKGQKKDVNQPTK